ncbi:hypothetical protein GGD63_006512 [Bradyrhizobium sp. cir1]|nr:hypothetical protein [Bradyrhizobium sp. cir1]
MAFEQINGGATADLPATPRLAGPGKNGSPKFVPVRACPNGSVPDQIRAAAIAIRKRMSGR